MNNAIQEAVNNLKDVVVRESGDNVTTFNVFMNCQEVRFDYSVRTPEQLNSEGISMRNLKGQFIK